MKTKYSKRITIGIAPDGSWIRKRFYGNSKTELDENIRKYKNEEEQYSSPERITFGSYAQKWYKTYKCNKELSTQNMYMYTLRKFTTIDSIPIRDVVQSDIQRIVNENSEHSRTCDNIVMTAKQIFNAALADGLVIRNPVINIAKPKKTKPQRRTLTESEKKAIRNADLEPEDRMYINCLYYFGLRPGECLALMQQDFDLKKKTLTVSRAVTFDVNTPVLKGTKTDNVRILPIPDQLIPKLRKYMKGLDSMLLFSRDGHPLSKQAHVRMWQRIKRRLNEAMGGTDKLFVLDNSMTEYIFRRTFATTLYYSGISLKKAAYLMGHADTTMILKVYAQLDDEKEDLEAVKKMVL